MARRRQREYFRNLWPTDLEESLAIQDAFDAKINEEIAGWKIAGTDKIGQRAWF